MSTAFRLYCRIPVFCALVGLACSTAFAQTAPTTDSLSMWLEANVGVTTDGSGNVLDWTDQSGNGHDATAVSGSTPTLTANGLNGLPVVTFDGATSEMAIAGQVLTSQQFTILAVVNDVRADTDGSFREVFSNWSGSNSTTSVFVGTTGNDPTRVRFTDDMGGATDPNNTQTGVGSLDNPQYHFILTGVSGASDATIYQNTTELADHGGPLSMRDLTGQYNLGTQGGSFEFWQGDLAEILVYNKELSQDELTTDWGYLENKYGLPQVPAPPSVITMLLGAAPLFIASRRRSLS